MRQKSATSRFAPFSPRGGGVENQPQRLSRRFGHPNYQGRYHLQPTLGLTNGRQPKPVASILSVMEQRSVVCLCLVYIFFGLQKYNAFSLSLISASPSKKDKILLQASPKGQSKRNTLSVFSHSSCLLVANALITRNTSFGAVENPNSSSPIMAWHGYHQPHQLLWLIRS
ncbi:hypothetical protein B0H63DRAFT_151968 [Podospora didyma]|uniref:Uncharacterized protein n=1 Tax=Podospora didyma TaxID=330526 RepID=A0AAE0NT30_9PEZI|nr:hypothetical protein B0H63DRAFT_151968 [Podospora didyma]